MIAKDPQIPYFLLVRKFLETDRIQEFWVMTQKQLYLVHFPNFSDQTKPEVLGLLATDL